MITVAKYVVMYVATYLIFVGLYFAITGNAHWFYCAAVLAAAEVFRVCINLINPGLEKRIAQKYGPRGAKLAEKHRQAASKLWKKLRGR